MRHFIFGLLVGLLISFAGSCVFLEEQWDNNKVRVYDKVIGLLEEEKEEGRTLEQVIERLRTLRDEAVAEVNSKSTSAVDESR